MRRLLLSLLLLLTAAPALAQHGLGAREQWQPQVGDTDARLQQPVEIEILGRAAVPALELLSEATGVSLSVAPENLTTVGERKLTVISSGLTLKTIMAQLPYALQECHWDVDPTGLEPIYLLHRNAGADYAKLKDEALSEWKAQRAEEERRSRVARVDEAVRALMLSADELEELEKSDYFLALASRNQGVRASLDAFVSLPPDLEERFLRSGELSMRFAEAPEVVRQATRLSMERYVENLLDYARKHPEEVGEDIRESFEETGRKMLAHLIEDELPRSALVYKDAGAEVGKGILLLVHTPGQGDYELIVVPPRYPDGGSGHPLIPLLLAAGTDSRESAEQTISECRHKRWEARPEEPRGQDGTARIDSTAGEPRMPFAVSDQGALRLVDFQRLIARETNLSIISDCFTRDLLLVPREAHMEQPLCRLLDLLGKGSPNGFRWRMAGRCIVFHRTLWPAWALKEIPEWLILQYREILQAQGRLTLDDVAAFYVALADLPQSSDPTLSLPDDLAKAGAWVLRDDRWALVLYDSLSPDQVEKTRRPSGLAFAEMTHKQRKYVTDIDGVRKIPAEQVARSTFHLEQSAGEGQGRPFTHFDFQLTFPDESGDDLKVSVRLPEITDREP
jgi:hypothetical protein